MVLLQIAMLNGQKVDPNYTNAHQVQHCISAESSATFVLFQVYKIKEKCIFLSLNWHQIKVQKWSSYTFGSLIGKTMNTFGPSLDLSVFDSTWSGFSPEFFTSAASMTLIFYYKWSVNSTLYTFGDSTMHLASHVEILMKNCATCTRNHPKPGSGTKSIQVCQLRNQIYTILN